MPLLSSISKELVNLKKKVEQPSYLSPVLFPSPKLINGFVNNFDTINKLANVFTNRPIQPIDQLRKPYHTMANLKMTS